MRPDHAVATVNMSSSGRVVLEAKNRLPDIAGVKIRLPIAALGEFIQRNRIVQNQNGSWSAVPLETDEIPERLLKEVKPVDETEAEGAAIQ